MQPKKRAGTSSYGAGHMIDGRGRVGLSCIALYLLIPPSSFSLCAVLGAVHEIWTVVAKRFNGCRMNDVMNGMQ